MIAANYRRFLGPLTFLFLVALTMAAPVHADDKEIKGVKFKLRKPCDSPAQTLPLGDVKITVTDDLLNGSASMKTTFTVTEKSVWDCLDVHWVQVVTDASGGPKPPYKGKDPVLPIIDAPNGGYDYMHIDGDPNKGIAPDFNLSGGAHGLPWYIDYSQDGNNMFHKACDFYSIHDFPSYQPGNKPLKFADYLVAEPLKTCNGKDGKPDTDCLPKNSFVLLAGFTWTALAGKSTIDSTFIPASTADDEAGQVMMSLKNGMFGKDDGKGGFISTYTAVEDGVFCCGDIKYFNVPEPSAYLTFSLFGGSLVCCLIRRKRRPTARR